MENIKNVCETITKVLEAKIGYYKRFKRLSIIMILKNSDRWLVRDGKEYILTLNEQYVIVSQNQNEIINALQMIGNGEKPTKNQGAKAAGKYIPIAGNYS